MRKFEIWMEGYAATGEYAPARLITEVEATSFQEACDKYFAGDDYYSQNPPRVWACRLFDNERDARKSFG